MNTLSYHTPLSPHRGAVIVFWLAIGAATLFFLVIPPLVVLLVSFFVWFHAEKNPNRPGIGYAIRAIQISSAAMVMGMLAQCLFMPSLGKIHVLSNRSICAANLRGIMQSMNVYAADNNNAYPSVHYAPYSAGLNSVRAAPGPASDTAMIAAYYNPPFRQAGSPQAILWQLVLRGDVGTKQFLCKSDPWLANPPIPAEISTPAGTLFDNFQDAHQLSYSIAYPWKSDGTLGTWWKSTADASLPFFSDMAPEQGTGSPARDVTALTKNANSMQHQSDGQNVAFGDAHVEFARLPNVGQDNDNIFTSSALPSTGPTATGGIPAAKFSPTLTADKPPYDTIMFPIRNESTGNF